MQNKCSLKIKDFIALNKYRMRNNETKRKLKRKLLVECDWMNYYEVLKWTCIAWMFTKWYEVL
jgi:hypothetical protein